VLGSSLGTYIVVVVEVEVVVGGLVVLLVVDVVDGVCVVVGKVVVGLAGSIVVIGSEVGNCVVTAGFG